MNNLNQELLFQRMAGGALRGPAAEETIEMRRCTGKLENGKRCSVVPLGKEEMCSSCKKRNAEVWVKTGATAKPFRAHDLDLKKGRPARKGAVSEAQAELAAATELPILCRSCAGDGVCEGSASGPTECAAYCPEVGVPTEAQEMEAQDDHQAGVQPETGTGHEADSAVAEGSESQRIVQVADDGVVLPKRQGMDDAKFDAFTEMIFQSAFAGDDTENTANAPCPGYLNGGPTGWPERTHITICDACNNPITDDQKDVGHDCNLHEWCIEEPVSTPESQSKFLRDFMLGDFAADLQISPVEDEPSQEHAEPCDTLSSPLAAVLVELAPPSPPLPDTSIVLDFTPEMLDALVGKGVGTATIIELLHVLFISEEYRLVRHAAA